VVIKASIENFDPSDQTQRTGQEEIFSHAVRDGGLDWWRTHGYEHNPMWSDQVTVDPDEKYLFLREEAGHQRTVQGDSKTTDEWQFEALAAKDGVFLGVSLREKYSDSVMQAWQAYYDENRQKGIHGAALDFSPLRQPTVACSESGANCSFSIQFKCCQPLMGQSSAEYVTWAKAFVAVTLVTFAD
jgi:hypothetical protein